MSAHPYKELYGTHTPSGAPPPVGRPCTRAAAAATPIPVPVRHRHQPPVGGTELARQEVLLDNRQCALNCSLITSVQATRRRAVWLSARLSSCDELPRPTDSRSRCPRLVLHLPAQERQAGRGMTFGKQTAEKARPQRVARRPALERAVLRICGSARAPVHYIVVGRLKPAAEGPGDNQVTKGVTKKQLYILYTPYPARTRLNQTHPLSVSRTENCFIHCVLRGRRVDVTRHTHSTQHCRAAPLAAHSPTPQPKLALTRNHPH